MTEFTVGRDYGKGIKLGIAVPGFDGSKWPKSDKYRFSLSLEEAKNLMEKLRVVIEA
ncbi:unnamed protein product [marine sediment metagenome]|uniref:Uncharacterized protein n=1 Tax=marine sediment metagenome TaxID=412755 RepID=X1C3W1_9ZZZZ